MPGVTINSSKPCVVTLKIDKAVYAHSGTYVCEMKLKGQKRFAQLEIKVENQGWFLCGFLYGNCKWLAWKGL